MGDGGRSATLVPRLSHIVRWHDFNGYGFNLHAEKGKAGQFIGKVDPGSPAEAAGLKQGDRIVEVNGINIGNENHQQVVRRIKAGGDETRLLVVDLETDEHYKEEKMVIRGDLPEVRFMTAVRDGQSEIETSEAEAAVISSVVAAANNTETAPAVHQQDDHSQHPVRLCKLCKWADFDGYGFNLHAEKEKPGQFIGSVDPASPAETGGLREGDRIIEVNGDNIETQTHTVVIQKVKAGGDRTELLVVDRSADSYYKARNITVSSAMAGVVVISTPPRMSDVEVVNGQSLEQEAQPVNNDESPAPPAPEEEATSGTVEITKTEEAEVTQTEEAEVTQTEEAEVPKYEIEVVKTEVEEIAVSEQTAEETDTVAAVMAPVLESPPPPAAVVEDAEETVPNGTPEVVVEHEMATGEAVVTVVADEVPAAELEDKTLEEEFNTYEQVEVTAPVSTESDHQEDLATQPVSRRTSRRQIAVMEMMTEGDNPDEVLVMVRPSSTAQNPRDLIEEQVRVAMDVARGPATIILDTGNAVADKNEGEEEAGRGGSAGGVVRCEREELDTATIVVEDAGNAVAGKTDDKEAGGDVPDDERKDGRKEERETDEIVSAVVTQPDDKPDEKAEEEPRPSAKQQEEQANIPSQVDKHTYEIVEVKKAEIVEESVAKTSGADEESEKEQIRASRMVKQTDESSKAKDVMVPDEIPKAKDMMVPDESSPKADDIMVPEESSPKAEDVMVPDEGSPKAVDVMVSDEGSPKAVDVMVSDEGNPKAEDLMVPDEGSLNAEDVMVPDESSPEAVDVMVVMVPESSPEAENVMMSDEGSPKAEVVMVSDERPKADDVMVPNESSRASVKADPSPPTRPSQLNGRTTSNGINGGSVEPEHVEPEPSPVIVTKVEEPEPAVIRSTTTTTTNTKPAAVDGDLNLHLSAAEMKERLKSRKKQDPRLQKTSFEAKHKMFERM